MLSQEKSRRQLAEVEAAVTDEEMEKYRQWYGAESKMEEAMMILSGA